MCALCVEIQNSRIKFREVVDALGEFTMTEDHVLEFKKVLEEHFTEEEIRSVVDNAKT